MVKLKNAEEQQKLVHEEIHRKAFALFSLSPDWVTFYRKVLGLDGIVRRHYRDQDALAEFEQTEVYAAIQQMLTKLREFGNPDRETGEPTRVITVRVPNSLHATLKSEAHEHQTSVNKLCISKLLQWIDDELVPREI